MYISHLMQVLHIFRAFNADIPLILILGPGIFYNLFLVCIY